MSAMADRQRPGVLQAIVQWFKMHGDNDARDLAGLSDFEIDHIAADIGVTSTELYRLAQSDSRGAELLTRRMKALDLDCKEVARLMPETLHDLQRLCALCVNRRRCAHDLGLDPSDPRWKDYCPNASTLTDLDAMPWATRKEW